MDLTIAKSTLLGIFQNHPNFPLTMYLKTFQI